MEFWINVKNLVSDPLDGHQWEVECFSKSQMMKEYWKYRKISTLCKKYKADADQVLLAWIRKHLQVHSSLRNLKIIKN